ncbi:MAG: hypothetical protein JKY37_10125 [Nannocystaceae bacterium]|nr:hypothetical protein [Nannocystaceae bacterium]
MKAITLLGSSLVAALALACDGAPQENNGGAKAKAEAKSAAKSAATPDAEEKTDSEKPGSEARDPASPAAPAKTVAAQSAESLEARVEQFAVAELTADLSGLSESETKTLNKLIEAARQLDPLFDRQAYAGNPELEAELAKATDAAGKAKYAYYRIMRGPWDRQQDFAPFATDEKRPAGGGYYPADLTEKEFRDWVAAHESDKADFESLLTVIERDGEGLVAKKYSDVYAKWLIPAAGHLADAAALTENASLKKFLTARASAFLSDDYYASDKAWMDLDGRVGITIGPYETYEDHLLGLKASYEAFVTISDPKASEDLAKFKKYLPAMEKHLPVAKEVKTKRGAQSPIRVVDLVFTSGDARKSVQTIAFNLPNDERVRKEKGAKKVLLRNLIRTKFVKIMKPIGEKVLVSSLHANLSDEAFFSQVLFHELSHSLGPAFTTVDGKKVEIRLALGSNYSALEECKADVMGAFNILFMTEKGEFEKDFRAKLLTSYFAGLFRSVRFGVSEAHGRGAAVQINRFLEDGAVSFDETKGEFSVDFDKLETSIGGLVHDLVMLQHEGDKAKADAFLDRLGVMSPPMDKALAKLQGIPVDIRPVYPVAGETKPR